MQKIIIYPYSLLYAPILRQLVYDSKLEIISAIMPGKWYEDGVDASYVDEGSRIGIPIVNNFEEELIKCTTVIWAMYEYIDDALFERVVCKIKKAMMNGKNIICQQYLSPNLHKEIVKLAEKYCVLFDYQYENQLEFSYFEEKPSINNVPIITIAGLGENCSKFETQLLLRRILIECGYNISMIGSRQGCRLLGIYDFPSFMFCHEYSEIEKINGFRNYVSAIEKNDNPDAIIIGIPGGIMPLNDMHNMGYGVLCYEILNAIRPDFSILNLWCQEYSDSFIQEMGNVMKYRFNMMLDGVCFSNIRINNESFDQQKLQYNIFNSEFVNNCASIVTSISHYNILDSKSCMLLKENLLSKLTN